MALVLLQHMSSRRHKDRLAGKPPKPKYSPYNKLQKNAALAVSILKVSVSQQITHPLPACNTQLHDTSPAIRHSVVLKASVPCTPRIPLGEDRGAERRLCFPLV